MLSVKNTLKIKRILIIGLVIITTPLSALAEKKPEFLYINKDKIQLNTPIERVNKIVYIPLRDALKKLNGTMTYNRNTNTYTVVLKHETKETTLMLTPESNQIMIDDTAHYIDQKVMILNTKVYVPTSFYTFLGYFIQESDQDVQLIPPKKVRSFNPKKSEPTETLKSSTKDPLSKSTKFNEKLPLLISFGNTPYDLTGKFYYKNNSLMINFREIFEKQGYTVTQKKNEMTVAQNSTKFVFSTKEARIKVTKNKQLTTPETSVPADTKESEYYIPLDAFIAATSYRVSLDKKSQTIQLIAQISEIKIITKNANLIVEVLSPHPLESQNIEDLKWDIGYEINFPNTYTLLPDTQTEVSKNNIEKIEWASKSKTTTLKILGNTNMPYPNLIDTNKGINIGFTGMITALSTEEKNKIVSLKITGTGPLNYKIMTLDDPPRCVIDIPNTESTLPQTITQNTRYFSQIRTSINFNRSSNTRIVIDLDTDPPKIDVKAKKNTLTFILSDPPITTVKKALTAKNEVKLSQPRYPNQDITRAVLTETLIPSNHTLSGKVIVIDAGHGGRDPGAPAGGDYFEKDFTLEIAQKLQQLLASKGAFVIMTRTNDTYRSLNSRVLLSNKNNADIFVSIHFNSYPRESMNGVETYYYKFKDKQLAKIMQTELVETLNSNNLGTKRARLFVIRNTIAPAILVEAAFLTNPDDRKKVFNPEYREKLSMALYKGILNYFTALKNKTYVEVEDPNEKDEDTGFSLFKAFTKDNHKTKK